MLTVDPTTAAGHRLYPSISLLAQVDSPTWRDGLRRLQHDAVVRLRAEFGSKLDRDLLARLDAAVSTATAPPGARAVAVYVNAQVAETVPLEVAVRPRAVIDDTFATRDVVHHDLRSPRYWVLALSLERPQLLQGHGSNLHITDLPLRDAVEHPSDGRDRRGRDRSDVVDARRTRRLRTVDMALGERIAGDRDPVVVVGAEPTLSRFLERTRHAGRIEGAVRRAPDRDLAALARTIAPVLADVIGERRVEALIQLDRAVSAGSSVSGIDQVWRAVRRQRNGLLLVEHGFEHPARLDADGTLQGAEDVEHPDVVDDVVDDLIELVLNGRGRVEIVPDDALARHQRIALVPDTRRKR